MNLLVFRYHLIEHHDESGDKFLLQKVPDDDHNCREGGSELHFKQNPLPLIQVFLKKVSNIHISIYQKTFYHDHDHHHDHDGHNHSSTMKLMNSTL